MESWSKEIEDELILLIKDWLKQNGKSQSEFCESLNLSSSRMPTLIEFLKRDFMSGGIPQIANRLCEIENSWTKNELSISQKSLNKNPYDQLDLLDEICEDLSKINFNK
tara:strand:+ start:664 stop:990 length:327 start_codon:yes stop_codon:yes gene_type:complete